MYPREPDSWGIVAWQEPPNTDPLELVKKHGPLGKLQCEKCKWSVPCHYAQAYGGTKCRRCGDWAPWVVLGD